MNKTLRIILYHANNHLLFIIFSYNLDDFTCLLWDRNHDGGGLFSDIDRLYNFGSFDNLIGPNIAPKMLDVPTLRESAQSQGSTDMNGAGVLRNSGDALSYTAGAIGGAQIGMMQYRSSLSIHSKVGTFPRFSSTYSSLGKFSGRLGTAGALVGVGFNINDLSTGEIGLGRFFYRLGSIGAAAGTGAAIGGPWGAVAGIVVGGISTGFEYIYDNYLVPLGNEIQYQIWNFENAIKNGWYPGR